MSVNFASIQEALSFLRTDPADYFNRDTEGNTKSRDDKVYVSTQVTPEPDKDEEEYYQLLQRRKNVFGLFVYYLTGRNKPALRSYLLKSKIERFVIIEHLDLRFGSKDASK